MSNQPGRNEPCWCGSGRKYKQCHASLDVKINFYAEKGYQTPPHSLIKSRKQAEGIRRSGKINTELLDLAGSLARPGITTGELDKQLHKRTLALGGTPAPLHYEGFPKSICTSVNSQVCHGIPSDQVIIKEGDILNVDVTTIYNGYYADSSRMYCIGAVSPECTKLTETALQCISVGLEQVRPWNRIGDVGHAVHVYAAQHGYSVVREVGGHGTGLAFHEEPWVGFTAPAHTGMLLVPGMVFTIEPMINIGGCEVYTDPLNDWTIYTKDGSLSAQWEVTVLVTENSHEVLA